MSKASRQAPPVLLRLVEEMVADSTHPQAPNLDVARWLDSWLGRRQPALDGRRPAELLGTPTGVKAVVRLLGSAEGGAYQ